MRALAGRLATARALRPRAARAAPPRARRLLSTDPHSVLGVRPGASADEIKKAYRAEALRWHPDRHGPERRAEAAARFKAASSAYDELSKPRRGFGGGGGGFGGFGGGADGFAGFGGGGFGGADGFMQNVEILTRADGSVFARITHTTRRPDGTVETRVEEQDLDGAAANLSDSERRILRMFTEASAAAEAAQRAGPGASEAQRRAHADAQRAASAAMNGAIRHVLWEVTKGVAGTVAASVRAGVEARAQRVFGGLFGGRSSKPRSR